ncbi:MAG: ion transporter [Thiohalomonas sp.]|nr:ion transporter [Thiohalomonas sp.]
MSVEKLRKIVLDHDTKSGRLFDYMIQFLIILSLITFSITTIPDLNELETEILYIFQVTIVSIFTIEYITRIILSKRKLEYIFSFYGIIDLLAILPFYITTSVDLRSIRVFRFLIFFRLFKLLRYSKAIYHFRQAFIIAKEELILFAIATCMLLYITSVGIYYFENEAQPEAFKSIFHSLWWAVSTLTTVGYGDIYPITAGGKIFTFFILMIGLGIVAVPAGLLSSALSQSKNMKTENNSKKVSHHN